MIDVVPRLDRGIQRKNDSGLLLRFVKTFLFYGPRYQVAGRRTWHNVAILVVNAIAAKEQTETHAEEQTQLLC